MGECSFNIINEGDRDSIGYFLAFGFWILDFFSQMSTTVMQQFIY